MSDKSDKKRAKFYGHEIAKTLNSDALYQTLDIDLEVDDWAVNYIATRLVDWNDWQIREVLSAVMQRECDRISNPKTLEQYFTIDSVLATGANGKTYRATYHGRIPVIIKEVLPPETPEDHQTMFEYIIGKRYMNGLRRSVPNFMYTYAFISCPGSKSGVCRGRWSSPIVYVVLELVPAFTSMTKFFDKSSDYDARKEVILQIYGAIEVARNVCGFAHNDLHRDNVLMVDLGSPPDEPGTVYPFYSASGLRSVTIRSRYLPVIIDYGYSFAQSRSSIMSSVFYRRASNLSIGHAVFLVHASMPGYDLYRVAEGDPSLGLPTATYTWFRYDTILSSEDPLATVDGSQLLEEASHQSHPGSITFGPASESIEPLPHISETLSHVLSRGNHVPLRDQTPDYEWQIFHLAESWPTLINLYLQCHLLAMINPTSEYVERIQVMYRGLSTSQPAPPVPQFDPKKASRLPVDRLASTWSRLMRDYTHALASVKTYNIEYRRAWHRVIIELGKVLVARKDLQKPDGIPGYFPIDQDQKRQMGLA